MGVPETVAREDGVVGEIVLRRRSGPSGDVYELIVNGTFLMDTVETSTERLLAEALLERHDAPRRVLVGGLGFGFTVRALLADPRVERVDVVELEPLLVRWVRAGLVPGAEMTVTDPRVDVRLGDIGDALHASNANAYDGILLDVDNGPGFIVREANAAIYQDPTLRSAARALAPEGQLAIWSAAPSDVLTVTLSGIFDDVTELVRTVLREGRDVDYHIYVAQCPSP